MKKKMSKDKKATFLGLFTICLSIISSLTIYSMTLAYGYLQNHLINQKNLIVYADEFGDASSYLTTEVRSYAVTGDKQYYDNYWNEVNTAKNRERTIAAMKEIGLTDEELTLLDKISSLSNGLVPLEEEAMNLAGSGDLAGAYAILYGDEYSYGVTNIQAVIEEFDEAVIARTEKRIGELSGYIVLFKIIVYSAGATVLLSIAMMALFSTRELIKPMVKVRDQMRELADGNLSAEIDLEVDTTEVGTTVLAIKELQEFQKAIIDDIGYLLGEMAEGNFRLTTKCEEKYIGDYKNILLSIRQLNRRLNSTLLEIKEAANQVDVGADQVSSAAQALSQGATEQAASVQELTATIEDVSVGVQDNAKNANEANGLSDIAAGGVVSSNEQMQTLIRAMDEISETSNEIGKIIKTIDDIAFQTNILALNAAVEAARAGAAGKGFAVVADEVRNLASKSAEAAKTTTELIESSITAINNGAKIADGTAKSLGEVVGNAQTVTAKIGEITEASDKQASAIMQITTGIEQISSVVQTNSATAEQSAAASEELSGQANMLKELINQFKLRDDGGSTYVPIPTPEPTVTYSEPTPAPIYSSNSFTGGTDKYSF